MIIDAETVFDRNQHPVMIENSQQIEYRRNVPQYDCHI